MTARDAGSTCDCGIVSPSGFRIDTNDVSHVPQAVENVISIRDESYLHPGHISVVRNKPKPSSRALYHCFVHRGSRRKRNDTQRESEVRRQREFSNRLRQIRKRIVREKKRNIIHIHISDRGSRAIEECVHEYTRREIRRVDEQAGEKKNVVSPEIRNTKRFTRKRIINKSSD